MGVAKALVALVAAVLAAVLPGFTGNGPIGWSGWVNVILLAAGAIQVYNASNDIPGWNIAKTVASAVTAGGVVLVSAMSDGVGPGEWIQVVIAVLGVLAVYAAPNRSGRHMRAA